VRFHSAVERAEWDGDAVKWKTRVTVAGGKDAEFGGEYTIESDYLVSAVGQLNVPHYPNIPGIDKFGGKLMHSARWDWSYSLEGKRIAIIGTGSFPLCCSEQSSDEGCRSNGSTDHTRGRSSSETSHGTPEVSRLGHRSS
jgi:hypothetical protein